MELIVCICDYWRCYHYYNRPIPPQSAEETRQVNSKIVRRLLLEMDAVSANYVLRELLQQQVLRHLLLHELGVELLWLKLRPPQRSDAIDYKWASMLSHTIWQHIVLEQLMCWLSTLGGGYSALGDQFEHCAQTAGKISLQQLAIGLRVGNTFLQARCKLFYSISLIQRGQLRQAKHLIRSQYRFAGGKDSKHKKHDQRLLHMCEAIWQRLCYEYEQRKRRRDESVKRF
ncbi:uncharacterized protein F58A4.6 [Drosophila grimshawi]|uniref:uncharacterized protein F58A4.6 n=1 Tax=Drosophila grimshawi TaxID=7222 RepID=UPI001C936435|nr:uncharacterized protein F58A4.6 [Drosophila grimshawi]